jgi:hypothetical protein
VKFCILCNAKYYAKNYCRKHYAALVERGGYKIHKCSMLGCEITTTKKYCRKHQSEWQRKGW